MSLIVIYSLITIAIAFPFILIAFLPIFYVYYRIQDFWRKTSVEIKRLESIAKSPLVALLGETLQGISTIRAYQLQDQFLAENEKRIDLRNSINYISQQCSLWLAYRLEMMGALVVGIAAGLAVWASPILSPALIGLALTYSQQLSMFANFCIQNFAYLEVGMNSVERLKHYAAELPQEKPARIAETCPPPTWPDRGAIDFQFLQLRYRPELPLVLDNVSLSIHGGEKVGVVGRTGAGKSSLVAALFRLTEAESGGVIIDGLDISTLGLADLRERLSIIPQDPVLYLGTIKTNLAPFGEHADEAIWHALERVAMKQVITDLQGLDTPVTENGENFSVGQRSQICLARALLRKSRILVLDEATARCVAVVFVLNIFCFVCLIVCCLRFRYLDQYRHGE
jgi:ATP-binding cassette subfamily C (CFTR/MRP) protein 1